ncbi:hypothetical protein [Herbiconiux sp. VKM Ac-2851]|uniref:hypothetical protein n=1 Tax=Herbiconiux sp. VKM Ac-2851 TaxID=2739025 RepID=UPI001565154B|nr:hypothetical protein [Herbiconiux sp. VKM Ac-2851]NQX37056.1 hypothetical protein [Herbiconiux sp. VKM Ac-2851]
MHPNRPIVVVYGDPLPDELIRPLAVRGIGVVHPSRPSGVPDAGHIGALVVQVTPESVQGAVEPRACRRRTRSVLEDLARLVPAHCAIVLLVRNPGGADSNLYLVGVRAELARFRKRSARALGVPAVVNAVIVPGAPDVDDLADRMAEFLGGPGGVSGEVVHSRSADSHLPARTDSFREG